jgi:hypothetical protein
MLSKVITITLLPLLNFFQKMRMPEHRSLTSSLVGLVSEVLELKFEYGLIECRLCVGLCGPPHLGPVNSVAGLALSQPFKMFSGCSFYSSQS